MTDFQPERTYEDMLEERKWNLYIPEPPKTDWPTMGEVVKEYPELCMEEQCWVLEALITEAHRKRGERHGNNN